MVLITSYTQKDEEKPFIIIIPTLNTCTAKNLTVWLALIYVYKGVLLLYGLFLAYETRNVVYAHLNDSRLIGICVYNVVVLSTIGAFLALILNNHQYEQLYAALSVCIIFPATVTISLIFIPKVRNRSRMVIALLHFLIIFRPNFSLSNGGEDVHKYVVKKKVERKFIL